MKKSKKILWLTSGGIFAVIFITFASFSSFGSPDIAASCASCPHNDDKKIVGNNNMITKSIDVTGADAVNISGAYDISINQENQSKASLTIDENIMPYINMSVTNNALNIGTQSGFQISSAQPGKVTIIIPTLHIINLGGATTLHANINSDHLAVTTGGQNVGYLKGNIKKLQINLRGDSELHVDVGNEDSMDIKMAGQGTVYLSGSVKNLTIATGGEATILGQNLIADNVKIAGAGESNLTIHAVKTLSIMTAGESNIKYYGNPTINKTVLGEINIEKMGE